MALVVCERCGCIQELRAAPYNLWKLPLGASAPARPAFIANEQAEQRAQKHLAAEIKAMLQKAAEADVSGASAQEKKRLVAELEAMVRHHLHS